MEEEGGLGEIRVRSIWKRREELRMKSIQRRRSQGVGEIERKNMCPTQCHFPLVTPVRPSQVTLHPSPVTVVSLLSGEVCFMDEFHGLTVEVDGALVVGQGRAAGRVGEMGREVGETTQSHWKDEEERREERGKGRERGCFVVLVALSLCTCPSPLILVTGEV